MPFFRHRKSCVLSSRRTRPGPSRSFRGQVCVGPSGAHAARRVAVVAVGAAGARFTFVKVQLANHQSGLQRNAFLISGGRLRRPPLERTRELAASLKHVRCTFPTNC